MSPRSSNQRSPLSHQSQMQPSGESLDQKILDVHRRIQTERKMLDASRAMQLATRNADVLRKTENQIKEAERSLSYFENMLRDLTRKKSLSSDGASTNSSISSTTTTLSPWSTDIN